jgi:hypothetical protein
VIGYEVPRFISKWFPWCLPSRFAPLLLGLAWIVLLALRAKLGIS